MPDHGSGSGLSSGSELNEMSARYNSTKKTFFQIFKKKKTTYKNLLILDRARDDHSQINAESALAVWPDSLVKK